MVLEEIKGALPTKDALLGFGKTGFHFLTYFFIFLIILITVSILAWWIIRNLKFKNKIIIYEKVGNNWEKTGRDKAMELKFNLSGDTVFYLRKRKKYIPRPELQSGSKEYSYAIREDGEWINFVLGDIDLAMKKAGAKYLHPEMRYARGGLLRNFKDRYDKPKFMEKYGMLIVQIVSIIIILVFMWLIIDKIISVGDKVATMVDTSNLVMDKANQVLSSLDNICSASGYRG